MNCKHWKRGWSGNAWNGGRWGGPSWGSNPWNHATWSNAGWSKAGWAGAGFFAGRNFRILSGLRRDPAHGKVAGVLAGIARYYGIRVKFLRIAAIIALVMNFPLFAGAYLLATFLMPVMPAEPEAASRPAAGESGVNAGTSARPEAAARAAEEELPPELRFAALRDKFRELEGRTGDMEGLVTSPEFRLRRDFKQMGEGGSAS
jgi:phage shock protein C